jgi:large subunit ribosomal protein L1
MWEDASHPLSPRNPYNMAKGKKYRAAAELIEKEAYTLDEAIELVKRTSITRFDGSLEIHAKLGLDPKQADQNIRTMVNMPNGTGKDIKVVAFVAEGDIKAATDAGATEAGTEELVKKIQTGWTDFDVAVAVPDQMKMIGKVAKVLGQKRLMPSPKAGTVTPDFANAISELKAGRIEIRVDKEANLHNIVGKMSFEDAKLKENILTFVRKVQEVKPASSKGTYLESLTLASTMGPGVPVDPKNAIEESRA